MRRRFVACPGFRGMDMDCLHSGLCQGPRVLEARELYLAKILAGRFDEPRINDLRRLARDLDRTSCLGTIGADRSIVWSGPSSSACERL